MSMTKLWVLLILILTGCATDPLEQALRLSGDNRPELERVLSHYRLSGDGEALRAAEFLIAGMPGHRSLSGSGMSDYNLKSREKTNHLCH